MAEHYPDELKYHREHAWIRVTDDEATIGVSWFAQHSLGEIVYAELPKTGAATVAGEPFAELESVKTVSSVYAPASGEVVAVNKALDDRPELVNSDCYGEGWLIRLRLSDTAEVDELLSAAGYEDLLAE